MLEEKKELMHSVRQQRIALNTASQVADTLYTKQKLAAGDMAIALRSGGYLAKETATVLGDLYKLTPREMAKNMRDGGYIAMSVAPKLREMGLNMNQAIVVLREVGYSASDVSFALKNVYSIWQVEDIIRELNRAGYSPTEIALYARNVANTPVHLVAEIFNKLGLPAKEAARALSVAYDYATQVMIAQALKYAKYGAEQVAGAMEDLYHLTAEAMTDLFKKVGYTAAEVANVMKNVYNKSAEWVAGALKSVYNLGGEAVEGILKGVGYAADQIKNAMKSAFDWIEKNLNPLNW